MKICHITSIQSYKLPKFDKFDYLAVFSNHIIPVITKQKKKYPNTHYVKYFSILLNTTINVLRTTKPYKIRVFKPFCRLLVALPKLFRTTQIVIRIIYTTLNSSIFLFSSVFLLHLWSIDHYLYLILMILLLRFYLLHSLDLGNDMQRINA